MLCVVLLMDNHYHFLIETPEANLSRGMQRLNGRYTQSFNRSHKRVGHIFQGRYKAILVEKESHLLELCRYIVLKGCQRISKTIKYRPVLLFCALKSLSIVPHLETHSIAIFLVSHLS